MTEPETGVSPGRRRGRNSVRGQSSQRMEKQEDGQMRQPCSGDLAKPTAPREDRLSCVTESPTASQVVTQHVSTNGGNPQGYDKTGWHAV